MLTVIEMNETDFLLSFGAVLKYYSERIYLSLDVYVYPSLVESFGNCKGEGRVGFFVSVRFEA